MATPGTPLQIRRLQGRLALARATGKLPARFDEGLAAFATPDGALLQAALLAARDIPTSG